MASVFGTPVNFTKEKNVWTLYAQLQFGANGAVSLVPNNSKGFCAVNQESVAFTGATLNSSTTFSSVSSYDGIFAGMTITGNVAGELQAATTVSSFTALSKTITLSKQAIITDTAGSYQATGGRIRLQLGTQAITQLTPYVKLLGYEVRFDVSTGSAGGNVGVAQGAPAAPNVFLVDNLVSTKTVPPTLATNSTDASIALQFGAGVGPGTGFVAGNPADGEIVRVVLFLGNSSAP